MEGGKSTGTKLTKLKNSEINRGIFEFDAKIVEFCPKSANFA